MNDLPTSSVDMPTTPVLSPPETPLAPLADPLWFKDAVIYQLHLKSFFDSNNDGVGDFQGLIEKLDYVAELGVTAIWMLPFYPSPRRDDGYDIADYTSVHADYGNVDDVRRLVEAAHARGLKVITELVINHTSDQHPWFQAARRAPPGSPERDFYVWSDTDSKYAGTRIIFLDTESSNWTFDPVANAYYWHRFYSHQPDLNFDNPAVIEEVFKVMRFWLDLGVDGLRLDAVPYLVEREGTNNENLAETHAILKKIRAEIDIYAPGRMLLAEANQWPEDAQQYFGEGDECHMSFHFPLMPRMYMAIAREDRFPITDIMRQTPEIPANCQWAVFLRNHDELTLEMVTSGERDYLVEHLCRRPPRPHQPRHPPPPGAAAGERPAPDRADERLAAVDAGHARHLLRRRDRHGRQHLPRRPRRRAHADALVDGPQRRLLARRAAAAGAAADHGPDLRLPGDQRRGAGGQPALHAELDPAHAGGPPAAQGVRPRHPAVSLPAQPQDPRLPARAHARERPDRDDPVRQQPGPHRAGGGAGPVGVRRAGAGGHRRRVRVPADRPAHLPADPAALRHVLVPAGDRGGAADLAQPTPRTPSGVCDAGCSWHPR